MGVCTVCCEVSAQDAQIEVRRNPNPRLASGGTPAIGDLVNSVRSTFNFSGGNPPTQVVRTASYQFNEPIEALIENLSAVEGPILSAADLGFGDINAQTGFDALFDAFFALYPEMEWATA